jgi:ribosomal protein S18 acetylase RimI-like enzyme
VATDVPGCISALREVHEASGYPATWPADPAGWLSPIELSAAWVALAADGRVLGHVCLLRMPGELEISRLFVVPSAQRSGLGEALLAEAMAFAQAEDLPVMLKVVEDGGNAIDFYERLDWRLTDRAEAGWTTPTGEHPVLRRYGAPHPEEPGP